MRKFLRAFLVAVMSVFLLHPSMMAHAEGENSATKGTNQEKVVVSKTKLQKLQADAADECASVGFFRASKCTRKFRDYI